MATQKRATERKPLKPEAELSALITRIAPAARSLLGTVRRALRKRLPSAHEVVYEYADAIVSSFSPDERGYEGVLAIRASKKGVQLYFNRGADLPDPDELLKGRGRQVRFIEVNAAPTLRRPAVKRLIEEAIAHTRVPFARAVSGPLVIRTTSAKKRRAN